MEEQWFADRCRRRDLLQAHPAWSKQQLAAHLGRSIGWVKKWRRRLRDAAPQDETVLWRRSRARPHPPPRIGQPVVARILAIREQPPANLPRVPGPKAILSSRQQDAELVASGARLPRSTRTLWAILTRHGRLAQRPPQRHEPLERPPPLPSWQLDFKDVTTVPADPDGKQQHVVETLNTIDTGTAILLTAQVREDFSAETALEAVVQTLQTHGVPETITIDRDPRFVGSALGRDFPSPFVRLLACLGVEVTICPPHRPDQNASIEHYHRTDEREGLKVQRPTTKEEAQAVTATFLRHYNEERPNQALSCGNHPPRVASPTLPVRPALPEPVDPDRWRQTVDGQRYVRKVRHHGTVTIEEDRSSVSGTLAGQSVVLPVRATDQALVVHQRQQVLKQLPLKGLQGGPLPFPDYLTLLKQQARSRRSLAPGLPRRDQPAA